MEIGFFVDEEDMLSFQEMYLKTDKTAKIKISVFSFLGGYGLVTFVFSMTGMISPGFLTSIGFLIYIALVLIAGIVSMRLRLFSYFYRFTYARKMKSKKKGFNPDEICGYYKLRLNQGQIESIGPSETKRYDIGSIIRIEQERSRYIIFLARSRGMVFDATKVNSGDCLAFMAELKSQFAATHSSK